MSWGGFESRKFPRVNADCKIYIQTVNQKSTRAAKTENIGIGGICVVLDEPLEKLSKVRIQLDLQDGLPPLECAGRVAWNVQTKKLTDAVARYDTGIEFTNLPPQSNSRLLKVIQAGSK